MDMIESFHGPNNIWELSDLRESTLVRFAFSRGLREAKMDGAILVVSFRMRPLR